MPDNIEVLNFNLSIPPSGSNSVPGSLNVSGSFTIDYTTNTVTGTFTYTDSANNSATSTSSAINQYVLGSTVIGGQTVYGISAGFNPLSAGLELGVQWTGFAPTQGNYIALDDINSGDTWQLGTNVTPTASVVLSFSAVCFCAGTRIRTERGDIAVEELAVGDLVVTASGAQKPIRWLGHREVDCTNAPAQIRPIRIAAHALGPDRPARNLLVSHDHAICFDILGEVLIPAGALVNGATITQPDMESVTYWHVELDEHDILIAESQPSESYIDTGNRAFFVENDVVSIGGGDPAPAPRGHADFCRPFHAGGPLIEALRTQLRLRAEALGWTLDQTPPLDLHLIVDGARIEPVIRGLTCRFEIPAGAQEIRLASSVARPADAGQSDGRELGVCIAALTLCDGFRRELADRSRRSAARRERIPRIRGRPAALDFGADEIAGRISAELPRRDLSSRRSLRPARRTVAGADTKRRDAGYERASALTPGSGDRARALRVSRSRARSRSRPSPWSRPSARRWPSPAAPPLWRRKARGRRSRPGPPPWRDRRSRHPARHCRR